MWGLPVSDDVFMFGVAARLIDDFAVGGGVTRCTCKGRERQNKKAESTGTAAKIKPEEARRKGMLCDASMGGYK